MTDVQGAADSVELRDYLRVLWRRRWIILLIGLVGMGAGLFISTQQEKEYPASGQLVLGAQNLAATDVATQAKVVESQAVHELATKKVLHALDVSTSVDGSSNVITVTAKSGDAKLAAESVNAHIDAYVEYERQQRLDQSLALAQDTQARLNTVLQQINALGPFTLPTTPGQGTGNPQLDALLTQRDTLQSQLRSLQIGPSGSTSAISVVARAQPASTPSGNTRSQNALIGLGIGLLVGILLAFLLEVLDDSINTPLDLEAAAGAGLPILGSIPRFRTSHGAVPVLTRPNSAAAESFRALRTALSFVRLDVGRCFEVTSAQQREGKTLLVTNLAIATAQTGRRVVLVDCDLRRPGVHELLNLPNDRGFTSVVLGHDMSDALQHIPGLDNLHVLTSGPLPPNPSEILASERSHDILRSLEAADALVFVDCAPLGPVTDAAALSRSVDGVIVVASAGRTTRRHVRNAVRALRQVGAPVVGLVLNRSRVRETTYGFAKRNRQSATSTPGRNGAVSSQNGGSRSGTPARGIGTPG